MLEILTPVFWALLVFGGPILNSEQIILALVVAIMLIKTMKVNSTFLKNGNWYHWHFKSWIVGNA